MALILLCLFGCPSEPVDSSADTGCEDVGDIDEVRFNIVRETCNWLLFDCGHLEQRHLAYCTNFFADQLIPPVEAEQCIDWCAAREHWQSVREQDCSLADPLVEEEFENWDVYFEPIAQPALENFYTCDEANYAPSGP